MLKIMLDQSCLDANCIWYYPGSESELIRDWQKGLIPFISRQHRGLLSLLPEQFVEVFDRFTVLFIESDLKGFILEEMDDGVSYLKIRNKTFRFPKRRRK